MKSAGRRFLAIALAGVLAAIATGAERPFIPPDAVDGKALLSGPPAAGSLFDETEKETMRNLQAARTPELVALARQYDDINVFALLQPVLGKECTASTLPRTAALFARVHDEIDPCIDRTKANWNRLRPYLADPTLQPVVYRPKNTSFPSGHSVLAETYSRLLAFALPEHAADWPQQSARVRWSRVVGGAHYPSDTMAGKLLGQALAEKLLESAELRDALREVADELRQVTSPATAHSSP